jgi:branched-chain amino acid aminotransferase
VTAFIACPDAQPSTTQVLHYAQEIFEGTKAYLRADGTVVTFRPWANAARFNASARRMVLPELPEELFVRSLELLIGADRDWVPGAPGGTGAAKCGGNYAAALAVQLEAMAAGCDQTVWLDAAEHRWVEEMGGMNLFFLYGAGPQSRLLTPPLTGTLLPGITRDSLLTLAPDLGIPVQEAALSAAQWRADTEAGLITEVFACGTAAVITPVGKVKSADGEWAVGDGGAGPVTMRLREALLAIQHGTAPDPYGWIHPVG